MQNVIQNLIQQVSNDPTSLLVADRDSQAAEPQATKE